MCGRAPGPGRRAHLGRPGPGQSQRQPPHLPPHQPHHAQDRHGDMATSTLMTPLTLLLLVANVAYRK